MPKRKTSIGHQPLDCSDGAKMLIEQMKEHPEEFKGFAGKFTHMLDTATEVVRGNHRTMSKRDAIAILAAAEEHLYEVWMAEDVLTSLMQPKPEPEVAKAWGTTTGRSVNKLGIWQGAVPPGSVITANTASNTINAQYEQAYQMELAKIALEQERRELREREDFKRREYEHAMRNTKPFKDFL